MRFSFVRFAAAAALLVAAFGASSANAESVMAACASQWKQAQSAGTTGGATWPQFLAQCKTQRAPSASIAPAPAPAPAPNPGSLFPWLNPAPSHAAAPAPTGAGQFSTEAEARYRCPTDKVVWVNTKSNIYHYQGSHNFAHTKQGAYMCEADARAAGSRAARRHLFSRQPG